jgi:hypothetical protein
MTPQQLQELKHIASVWLVDAPFEPAGLINEERLAFLALELVGHTESVERKLAAAERRAFAVEEAGCPRCGSYKSLEAKCQEAERREDAMEKLFREERRRYAAAYGCFHRDDYDAETEAKIKEARG